jgi:hypothetical protein
VKNHLSTYQPPSVKCKIDVFEHTLLAGQCVKRGIRLADLGATKTAIHGQFKVVEIKFRNLGKK